MKVLFPLLVCVLLSDQVIADDDACLIAPYEYCQVGCEVLGEFVAVPVDSLGEAFDRILELDPVQRYSIALVQPQDFSASYLLVYRARLAEPAEVTAWKAEAHDSATSAEASLAYRLHLPYAMIVETNDAARQFLVLYREACSRPRAVR